jgi:hypothetical protein
VFLSLKPFRHNGSLSDAHFECSFASAGLLQGPENPSRLQRQTTALKAMVDSNNTVSIITVAAPSIITVIISIITVMISIITAEAQEVIR